MSHQTQNNHAEAASQDEEVSSSLSVKDFKGELKRITEQLEDLLDICGKVANLPRGKQYEIERDGKVDRIGRREYNQARSQFVGQINALGKLYAQAKKPKKRAGTRRPGTGFRIPIRVSQNLSDFFREANLGPMNPSDPKSPALKSQIPLLTEGCTTSAALLTPLFSIYAIVNNLTGVARSNHQDGDPNKPLLPPGDMNHQMLGADKLMFKHFTETFRILTNRGDHYTEKGTLVEAFDPLNFKYASFQSIVSLNRRTKDGKIKRKTAQGTIEEDNPAGPALTDEEIESLSQDDVRMELDREQKIVSDCLKIYRDLNKPLQKELRKGKRKSAAPAPTTSVTTVKVTSGKR